MKKNLIAHYSGGGSDKVYMACVRDNDDGTFTVIGKWGRRGAINQSTVKVTTDSSVRAELEQRRLFQEKLNKGYSDIDSPNYTGVVTRNDSSILPLLEPDVPTKSPKARGPKPVSEDKPVSIVAKEPVAPLVGPFDEDTFEDEVVCVKNYGMEDRFTEGVEYVAEQHKNEDMLWVYDKFGKKAECFKDRFVPLSIHKATPATLTFNVLKNREPK